MSTSTVKERSKDGVAVEKTFRDPGYGQRLIQACDANPHCPEHNHGRYPWIVDQLVKRSKIEVTVQSVARWMAGEVRPRQDKSDRLAEILGVDPTWLFLGLEPGMTPRERRVRNATADGAVNLVAGLIQMDGGHPAFPEQSDAKAQRDHVDLYAVIRGANYSIHVALATPEADGWRFTVPKKHEDLVVLGVVRSDFNLRILVLQPDLIDELGVAGNSTLAVTLSNEQTVEMALPNFRRRL